MNVIDRFLKYVSFGTNSDEESASCPSTAVQFELARYIEAELKEIGLSDVRLDDKCYVYAYLPASEGCEDAPVIGLISHMDTSSAVKGDDIHPSIIRYEGGDIKQSDKESICEADFPFLKDYVGQDPLRTAPRSLARMTKPAFPRSLRRLSI